MKKNRNARTVVWEDDTTEALTDWVAQVRTVNPTASAEHGTFDVWGVAR